MRANVHSPLRLAVILTLPWLTGLAAAAPEPPASAHRNAELELLLRQMQHIEQELVIVKSKLQQLVGASAASTAQNNNAKSVATAPRPAANGIPPPSSNGAVHAPPASVTAAPPIDTNPPPAMATRMILPFTLYAEGDVGECPYSSTGWMGNQEAIEMEEASTNRPHSGRTCIRASYKDTVEWAGVAWLNPDNNWGDLPGGYDLRGAKQLSFWARGENGGEEVEFKVGVEQPERALYTDTVRVTTGKITLHPWWKRYTLSLKNENLSRVITGFVWLVEGQDKPVTFYLDDIVFE